MTPSLARNFISIIFAVTLPGQALADITWIPLGLQNESCKEMVTGNADQGEDYIIRQCDSFPGVSTYLFYQEGTRLGIGFGTKSNIAFNGADASRGNWPVVWGGEKQDDKFTPQVAIARFTFAGEEPKREHLLVFRLLENGMSCVVGDVRKNDEAQRIAIAAAQKWTCLVEPLPLP
jgi:hypothetical protein